MWIPSTGTDEYSLDIRVFHFIYLQSPSHSLPTFASLLSIHNALYGWCIVRRCGRYTLE